MRTLAVMLGLAACGGGGGTPLPDAAPDAFIPPPPTHQTFVLSQQLVPADSGQAQQFGRDLNNDTTVDNQLGLALATLAGQGFLSQATTTQAVDRGSLIQLLAMGIEELPSGIVTIEMFRGVNPIPTACNGSGDTVCRRHLDGLADFGVDATVRNDPFTANVAANALTTPAGGAAQRLRLLTTLDGTILVPLDLIAARVEAIVSADSLTQGVIAGAVPQTSLDAIVLPAWQMTFTSMVARDCPTLTPPDCGCTGQGATVISTFDTTPNDCTITVDEVRNNTLIQSLLAPDVTIDGTDALSVGIGFEAVPGDFVVF